MATRKRLTPSKRSKKTQKPASRGPATPTEKPLYAARLALRVAEQPHTPGWARERWLIKALCLPALLPPEERRAVTTAAEAQPARSAAHGCSPGAPRWEDRDPLQAQGHLTYDPEVSELRTFHGCEAYRISLFRNIALVDVASTLDEAAMLKVEQAIVQLRRELASEIGALAILRSGAPIPDAGARAYASHIIRAHGEWLTLAAVVVEDSSLVMQLFRSVVRSINFIAGRSRIHVFPHLMAAEEALVAQLSPQGGAPSRLSEFRAAVHEARADFAAHSPGSPA